MIAFFLCFPSSRGPPGFTNLAKTTLAAAAVHNRKTRGGWERGFFLDAFPSSHDEVYAMPELVDQTERRLLSKPPAG